MTSSAARCDRILTLIDACLDELAEAARPPARDSGETWGRSNVIPLGWRTSVEAFSPQPA